jgi:hypothetical protein
MRTDPDSHGYREDRRPQDWGTSGRGKPGTDCFNNSDRVWGFELPRTEFQSPNPERIRQRYVPVCRLYSPVMR